VLDALGIPRYKGPKLSAKGTNFVPDFLHNGEIGDIKDVAEIAKTSQLEAIAGYGAANGLKPVLYVGSSNSRISPWVRKAFDIRAAGF